MITETYEQAFRRLEERTYDNKVELDKTRRQRRSEFTDNYGQPHVAFGDANVPARFYISVSQDLTYYLRFQFKLNIQPFLSTVSGGTDNAIVDVKETSLSINNNAISPNPHDHETEPHTHNLVSGVTVTHTTSSYFRVLVEGIDITAYLMEQHGGEWIDGEGIYPSKELEDTYDLLQVIGLMDKEGRDEEYETLHKAGFKEVQIVSDAPFMCTMYVYLKHGNVGR